MSLRSRFALLGSLMLLGLAAPAQGEQIARRYEVKTPLSDINAGAYRTDVHAPIDVVRRVVTDFGSYSSMLNVWAARSRGKNASAATRIR